MALATENVVPIRGPFGGLELDAGQRRNNRACIEGGNIYGVGDVIKVRPGYDAKVGDSISPGDGRVLAIWPVYLPRFLWFLTWGRSAANRDVFTFLDQDYNALLEWSRPAVETVIAPDVEVYDGRLYVSAGASSADPVETHAWVIYKYQDVWYREPVGLEAPSVTPVAYNILSDGVGPVGVFTYKVTHYNERNGFESPPSDASAKMDNDPIVGSRVLQLGGILPSNATHIKVYRRNENFDTAWYYLERIPNPNVGLYEYTDDNDPEIVKSPENILDEQVDLPPDSSVLCSHNRRLWWVNGPDTSGGSVRFSEPDKPNKVSALTSFSIAAYDDWIHGMVSAMGVLWLFGGHNIWTITGTQPSTFSLSPFRRKLGLLGKHTLCCIDGAIFFVGSDCGVYRINRSGVQRLDMSLGGSVLQEFFQEDQYEYLTGAHLSELNCYVINGLARTGEFGQLVYDYVNNRWWEWSLPFSAIGTRWGRDRDDLWGVRETDYAGPTMYLLETSVIGRGSIERNPVSVYYEAGTSVFLAALASPGWAFSHWLGDLEGNVNPNTILMDSSKAVTAVFIQTTGGNGDDGGGWTGDPGGPYQNLPPGLPPHLTAGGTNRSDNDGPWQLCQVYDALTTDAGENIFWLWRSMRFDLGTPRRKRLYRARLLWEPQSQSAGDSCTLQRLLDTGPSGLLGAMAPADNPQSKSFVIGREAETVQFYLEGTASVETVIQGIDVEAQVVERR